MVRLGYIREFVDGSFKIRDAKKINLCLESHLEAHGSCFVVFGDGNLYRTEQDVRDSYRNAKSRPEGLKTLSSTIFEFTKKECRVAGHDAYEIKRYDTKNISKGKWTVMNEL